MPGQFINSGNTLGGSLKLTNVNNQGSLVIGGGASFTILSLDITNGGPIYQATVAQGTNGEEGFINTSPQNWLYEGYYAQGLSTSLVNAISNAYQSIGLDPNNSTGYVWNVTWGAGSSIASGLVKFGFYAPGTYFDMQTIDPTDTNYQQQNTNNGTSLAGTFLFPATLTPYLPLIDKNGWC